MFRSPNAANARFELLDKSGKPLLVHTEDTYDWTPESEVKPGPQAEQHPKNPIEIGADQELNGDLPAAMSTYAQALERTPDDFELNRAAGRLAATMKNYDAAIRWLSRAQAQVTNDPDTQYYLGLAYLGSGDPVHARTGFEGAQRQPQLRAVAKLQLAMLDAREGRYATALDQLRAAISEEPA